MRTSEVVHILDALERVGVRYWLTGGWGVDALHGEAAREHRDLDLAIDAETFGTTQGTLEAMGFTAETNWLPVPLEMPGGPGGWVDLHPVRFDSNGDGVQQGLDRVTFAYPAADLVVGSMAAKRVPCISHRLQAELQAGYDPRPQDLHDLRIHAGLEARSPSRHNAVEHPHLPLVGRRVPWVSPSGTCHDGASTVGRRALVAVPSWTLGGCRP